jgi:hypothetical protein
MSAGKRFVLDANVFIQAYRRYYAFDICRGFWRGLLRHHEAKRVFSIDKVKHELLVAKDRLADWVKDTAPDTLFKGTADKAVTDAYREMVNWAQGESQFTPAAKAEFASVADGWVIAFARAYGHVVVTHEEYAPDAKSKVPMPNVCLEFDVEYRDTFEMLRMLGVELGLLK